MLDFKGSGNCTCGKTMTGGGGDIGGNLDVTWRQCNCGIKAIFYVAKEDHVVSIKAEHENQPLYDLQEKEKLLQCFNLSNIEVLNVYNIENGYMGGKADWLLVKTVYGLIKIGWRKRVINIDWEDTGLELIINDDVTSDKHFVHAWSYSKAVSYLEHLVNEAKLLEASRL